MVHAKRARQTSVTFVGLLVAASAALAGCLGGFGGGSDTDDDEPPYTPQTRYFELYLKPVNWELYPGTIVPAWLFADSEGAPATLPGPTIRVTQGDRVVVDFNSYNGAPMPHTVHWHGLHVPWNMDGVPYVSQLPIGQDGGTGSPLNEDRNTFRYEFVADQPGTYWYHCHVDTAHHLDMGMYGAFIVDPADPKEDPAYSRDYTLMFDEWDKSHVHGSPGVPLGTLQNEGAQAFLDEITQQVSKSGDPQAMLDSIYSQLRDYYNQNAVLQKQRQDAGLQQRNDYYPADFPAYFADYDTFLINGKSFPSTETLHIRQGETIRLRLISAGFEVHAIHLHGHHMLVTHKDGYKLASPYYADTILIGPGERYDAYVTGDNPGPWMLHDHIALNEMNDHIAPGGIMTMLCYEDGWDISAASGITMENTHCHEDEDATAGEMLMMQAGLLAAT